MKLLLDDTQMRKYKLLYYLYYNQEADVTLSRLSELLQVSKKTILADLNEISKKNYILSKKALIKFNMEKGNIEYTFTKNASILEIRQFFFEQSITFKLLNHFFQNPFIKIKEFTENYYYSLSVVYKKINELKKKIKTYGLEIHSEHGRLYLIGQEERKRSFYGEFYYYIYGSRSSFLDDERDSAKYYLKKIESETPLDGSIFQKEKLSILIAVSFRRMKSFPLKYKKIHRVRNTLVGNKGQEFLEYTYANCSKKQIKLEHRWILHLINEVLGPFIVADDKTLLLEGIDKISDIFKFNLVSEGGKEFKRMMIIYYKEKKNNENYSILSQLSFQNGPVLEISTNVFLNILKTENHKEELEHSLYPVSIEETASILKISGVAIKKIKLAFLSEYPEEWHKFLYRKILTLELEQFYEWSNYSPKVDVVLTDNNYPFIGKKKQILISPFPSDTEIKNVQSKLVAYINNHCKN